MKPSPFEVHREKVLGHYRTAVWLRSVVLALWGGAEYPAGLSELGAIDSGHYQAFLDMVESYHQHGENDPAFMSLALEVLERGKEEAAANEREDRHKDWRSNARHELRVLGVGGGVLDDEYNWFESQFDLGTTPADAAQASANKKSN